MDATLEQRAPAYHTTPCTVCTALDGMWDWHVFAAVHSPTIHLLHFLRQKDLKAGTDNVVIGFRYSFVSPHTSGQAVT